MLDAAGREIEEKLSEEEDDIMIFQPQYAPFLASYDQTHISIASTGILF